MGRMDGKVAVITGAADGIGEATGRLFVQEGARVVAADIDDERGRSVVREWGGNALYLHTDVTQEAQVKAAIDLAVREFGRIDCLHNNAGGAGMFAPIQDIPVEAFDQTIALMLRAAFIGIKYAAPIMKAQGSGSIINTASVAGFRTGDSDHSYSVAKAGIIQLTRTAAMELGVCNVRVNCISPGFVVTGAFQKAAGMTREAYIQRLPQVKEHFASFQPLRRACLPEDIARAVLWLASDESAFVNGANLVVDGGMSNGKTWSQCLADMGRIGAVLLG
ncbi:MAG: glucose 1-dehydrogenase [Dehalococcoidia bacterium]|nr:glucose 1-dehydrogenase [Dehalococcoidia bacterium]